MKKERLLQWIDELAGMGNSLVNGAQQNENRNVNLKSFTEWWTRCVNLMRALGTVSKPWEIVFAFPDKSHTFYGKAVAMLGALDGLRTEVQDNLLVRIEALILAEEFGSLLEQAQHLFDNGFFLAAGVLCRAVLEEHLRNWCLRVSCTPPKPTPTLGDFTLALYGQNHIDKVTMKYVDAMAAVGNLAAHNKPELKKEDVERLLRDVGDFLVRFPLP